MNIDDHDLERLVEFGELLPVAPTDPGDMVKRSPMADVAWQLDFNDIAGYRDGPPILIKNKHIPDSMMHDTSSKIYLLGYPTILWQILSRIHHAANAKGWQLPWLKFAMELPGVCNPPKGCDNSLWCEWRDGVVASFCRKYGMINECCVCNASHRDVYNTSRREDDRRRNLTEWWGDWQQCESCEKYYYHGDDLHDEGHECGTMFWCNDEGDEDDGEDEGEDLHVGMTLICNNCIAKCGLCRKRLVLGWSPRKLPDPVSHICGRCAKKYKHLSDDDMSEIVASIEHDNITFKEALKLFQKS